MSVFPCPKGVFREPAGGWMRSVLSLGWGCAQHCLCIPTALQGCAVPASPAPTAPAQLCPHLSPCHISSPGSCFGLQNPLESCRSSFSQELVAACSMRGHFPGTGMIVVSLLCAGVVWSSALNEKALLQLIALYRNRCLCCWGGFYSL